MSYIVSEICNCYLHRMVAFLRWATALIFLEAMYAHGHCHMEYKRAQLLDALNTLAMISLLPGYRKKTQ
jgi:hypothetical protein